MKSGFKRLVEAAAAEDSDDFIQAVEDHINRVDGANLEELLEAAPRKELPMLCTGLKKQAERGVELFQTTPSDDLLPDAGEGDAEDEEQVAAQGAADEAAYAAAEAVAAAQELGSTLLYGVALVVRLVLKECRDEPPLPLQQAAQVLHDHALLAAADFPALQEEVARLCLEWWQAEAPGRDRLSPQTVPLLLLTALQQGTGAAVKRCHTMRTALALFDFEDASAADLKRLLLQAAFAPCFLKVTEGRRFLSFLFELQPAFVRELTAIVRNQIPSGRKSVLDAYGDILYRAWTNCTGACALELQHCIQGLMEAAILASTPAMAANLRRVLAGFHGQKHQTGVDKMLLELYEPILFRRLNAANPEVRRNALAVFLDAFPLRDPEESNEDTDRRLTEQFSLLTKALKDEAPAVRVAAVAGVCRVLNEFWELIPAAVTAGYVRTLAGELAYDAASPAVRAAVAEGLASLVDNALAQPLLKAVLPQLEPLLSDPSSRVRAAFADLLLALRGIQALRWHDVVGLQKLLDVMAADVPSVSERIQRLLLPSYLPDLEQGPALVAALLRTSPEAGKAFCQYLVGGYAAPGDAAAGGGKPPSGLAVHEDMVVALIDDLKAHLLEAPLAAPPASAKTKAKGRSKRRKGQAQSDEETEEEVMETPESWAAIMEGLAALACGLAVQVAVGAASADATQDLFHSGTLVRLLERAPTSAARCAVMATAAALPALDASAEVRGRCLKQLLSGDYAAAAEGGELGEELSGAVACMAAGAASCPRLLHAVASALGADEEAADVLPQQDDGAGAGADGQAAKEEEGEAPARDKRASRAKKGGAAAAKKKQPAAGTGRSKAPRDTGHVDNSLACDECGSRAGDMLLCDYCEKAFHLGCLDPPLEAVPEGDWFCAGCEAEMQAGMGAAMAVRVLGLLLEQEAPRDLLLSSGLLPRLLPHMDAALEGRVAALKRALSDGAGATADEAAMSAPPVLVVYLKACLHLHLAAATITAVDPASALDAVAAQLPAAAAADGVRKQALECMQQAMDWAGGLAHLLGQVDVDDLLQAVEVCPTRAAKRAKSSKGKGKAASAAGPVLSRAASAVREAYEAVLAVTLLLGDAARLRALAWSGLHSAPATAQGAATLATTVAGLAGRMAEGIASGSNAEAEETVVNCVATVARLVRALAASLVPALSAMGSGGRDLNAENWDASESASAAASRAAALTVLADAMAAIMSAGCADQSGLWSAALKPHMAGLLAGFAEAARSADSASDDPVSSSAAASRWLQPVSSLLGSGFDLSGMPAATEQLGAEGTAQADDEAENAGGGNAACSGDAPPGGKAAGKEAAPLPNTHCEHALVKQLIAAARLVKAQEQLARQAACCAAAAWQAGQAAEALGAVQLCELLGFKGVNQRGRSKAGGDSYASAIRSLKQLQQTAPDSADATAVAAVHARLTVLFPPPPRVTFDF